MIFCDIHIRDSLTSYLNIYSDEITIPEKVEKTWLSVAFTFWLKLEIKCRKYCPLHQVFCFFDKNINYIHIQKITKYKILKNPHPCKTFEAISPRADPMKRREIVHTKKGKKAEVP